jgi:glycosyltransferase involved in cell wall biosynthesis
MRIAQLSPLWLEVPPFTYGGTEYMISLLTEELIKRGHQVTLFATADSRTSAELVPVWPKGLFKDANVQDPFAVLGLLYKELFERQEEFDIIHDHCEIYTAAFSRFLKPPIVTTLHSIFNKERIILYKKFPNVNYVAISHDQRKSGHGVNFIKTIHHGLPIEKYEFNSRPKDYLLWISNIAPDKGLAEAIEIAKMAGEKLIISGPIFHLHAEYFERRIKPLIDGKQIQFVGVSDFEKKIELLKNAKAFLFPIFKRQEPFGLVVIEAMACGTPVIAARSGSMPELIENEKNGFIINSQEEALAALKKIGGISREYCRAYVKKNFSLKTMVNHYERLYKNVLEN